MPRASRNGILVVVWEILVSISASSGFPNRGNDFLKVFYISQIYSPCFYYLDVLSETMDLDSAKLTGGGRPPKKRGVGRSSSSAGSDWSKRKQRNYDASRNSSNVSGTCDSSEHDADESDSNAQLSESSLSTQDSKASSRGRGRQKKQKGGPGRGHKRLRK